MSNFKAIISHIKGATRTKDARELLYARQKVVVITKAFGLQAIDLVYIDYQDGEGLRQQAREGALMGFTGRIFLNYMCTLTHTCTPTNRGNVLYSTFLTFLYIWYMPYLYRLFYI